MHEASDLLGIHDNSHMEKPHIDTADAFFVTSEKACFGAIGVDKFLKNGANGFVVLNSTS